MKIKINIEDETYATIMYYAMCQHKTSEQVINDLLKEKIQDNTNKYLEQ